MDYEPDYEDYEPSSEDLEREPDPAQIAAESKLVDFLADRKSEVFFSRQIEVTFEDEFYHWITNRAIHTLIDSGLLTLEERKLTIGAPINLLWHKNYRYYKRDAENLYRLVDEYANPDISAAIGLHGEFMTLEGFAKSQFVVRGRNTNEYKDKKWTKTGHNLDFIFERDGVAYGVEVKNTLSYMEQDELKNKIELCKHLGIKPLFVVRMIPKTWAQEIIEAGGFALILKYQLYPKSHASLAKRIRERTGMPVDSPQYIKDGTIKRFTNWHEKNL